MFLHLSWGVGRAPPLAILDARHSKMFRGRTTSLATADRSAAGRTAAGAHACPIAARPACTRGSTSPPGGACRWRCGVPSSHALAEPTAWVCASSSSPAKILPSSDHDIFR